MGENDTSEFSMEALYEQMLGLANDPTKANALAEAMKKLPPSKASLVQNALNHKLEVPLDAIADTAKMEEWKQHGLLALEMYSKAKPCTVQENMGLAALEALKCIFYGNFSVGAVLESVADGSDGRYAYTFVNRNQANSIMDPTAHAEIQVIRDFLQRGTTRQGIVEKTLARKIRVPSHQKLGTRMFTTLEPCYGCARVMLGNDIDEIIVATEDPHAGALFGEGRAALERIPHARKWLETHKVSRLNYQDPSSSYYVDPKFRSLLEEYLPEQNASVRSIKRTSLSEEYATTPEDFLGSKMPGIPKIWELF